MNPMLAPVAGAFVLEYRHPGGRRGWMQSLRNGVTIQGCNWLLDTGFLGIPQVQPVRCGLIAEAGFTGVDPTDTHDLHPGWTEQSGYSGSRPVWIPDVAASGQLGTGAAATFTFTADGTLKGVFLADVATVGSVSSAGVLYNTAYVISALPFSNGGTLDVSFIARLGV